jgi:anti-sigma factor RsiW
MRGDCLSLEQIDSYVNATMPPPLRMAVEAHMAGCDVCRRRVEVRQSEHDLAEKIRAAYRAEEPPEPV